MSSILNSAIFTWYTNSQANIDSNSYENFHLSERGIDEFDIKNGRESQMGQRISLIHSSPELHLVILPLVVPPKLAVSFGNSTWSFIAI